jgi:hypothetical protein
MEEGREKAPASEGGRYKGKLGHLKVAATQLLSMLCEIQVNHSIAAS